MLLFIIDNLTHFVQSRIFLVPPVFEVDQRAGLRHSTSTPESRQTPSQERARQGCWLVGSNLSNLREGRILKL